MALIRYAPPAPLDAFVECLWAIERREPLEDCEHALPSARAELVVPLHGQPIGWARGDGRPSWQTWTSGIVHGPQSRYYLAGPKPAGIVVGASFRHGAAGAILGVPASELADRHVPIEELWGSRGRRLHERLAEAGDAPAALRVLEEWLLARIRRPLLVHPAVAHALEASSRAPGAVRVAQLCRETGYSARHFIEQFRSAVGLAPKHFLRIRRLGSVLTRIAAGERSLAELAASAGYADQSHLTRELRELAGITPSAYRPRSPESPFHHVAGAMPGRGPAPGQ